MSLAVAKTTFLRGFVTAEEAETFGALELTRELIATQVNFFHFDFADTGPLHRYATQSELLSAAEPSLGWKLQTPQVQGDLTPEGAFWRSLVPSDRNGEVLAGWITEIHANSERFIVLTSQKVDPANPNASRNVFVSDDHAIIYRAKVTGPTQPAASSLAQAGDFPGGIPFNLYSEYQTAGPRGKIGYIFKSVAYRLGHPAPLGTSQCWDDCTGIFGCDGTCWTQAGFCPCMSPPCDSGGVPGGQLFVAAKVCGASDCGYCVWSGRSEGGDCQAAANCTKHVYGTVNSICCRCYKCHVHCG